MANEKIIAKKQAQVEELAKEIKEAKVVLLADYRGITVTDVTKLRADLRNVNAEYKVIKNNIIKRALDANGESALDSALEGPVALVMSKEDYLEPSKIIYNFTKDHDFYKIKGGIVEGKVMTAEEIITLAKLPSRQNLLELYLEILQNLQLRLIRLRCKKRTPNFNEKLRTAALIVTNKISSTYHSTPPVFWVRLPCITCF